MTDPASPREERENEQERVDPEKIRPPQPSSATEPQPTAWPPVPPEAGAAELMADSPGAGGDLGAEPDASALGVIAEENAGQRVLHVSRERYFGVVESLKAAGYEMCADLCAVDFLAHPARRLPPAVAPERFEVVVNLLSLSRVARVRLRVQVPESDPVVDSLFPLYGGTEAMEREAFDLLGVRFRGHPDLSRILMPEEWEGHPLRKDFGVGRIPVRFKEAPGRR